MVWTSGIYGLELVITKAQAAKAAHMGNCDESVFELSQVPKIAKQLAKLPANDLANELRESGAWDDTELADHAQNLQRILWIACGDILDGHCS
jgi:hypothetical protein